MTPKVSLLGAVCAAGLSLCAQAQQSTVSKIVFRGAGPYSQADLEAAAKVHPGEKMSLADMQAAAQRLVDTGCFDTVKLDSSGSPGALTLVFVLKPSSAGEVHPVGFDNFVWFTPDELMGIVRKVAPLVGSGLPEGGGVLDDITAALQTALATKGVSGAEVGHTLVLATSSEPLSTIEYRVNKPFVALNTVTLAGVSPEFGPAVQGIATKLRGKPYLSGPAEVTEHALLAPYLNAGYLDAHLADVELKPTEQPGGVVAVNLAATVQAGEPYHVAAIGFQGDSIVPSTAFTERARLHAGDVASRSQLLASLAPVDAAYHKLGYMDEYVDPGATLDRGAHTVSYELHAVPGEVYRVHSVTVQGLSPEARAEFDQAWALKPGAPYDAAYVRDFLGRNTAMRTLGKYAGGFQAAADPATHQVDVTVTFAPMPGR